jgi:hypothetical protein
MNIKKRLAVYINAALASYFLWSAIRNLYVQRMFLTATAPPARRGYIFWSMVQIVFNVAVPIGLVKMKEWGRQLALASNYLYIFFNVAYILPLYFLMPHPDPSHFQHLRPRRSLFQRLV